MFSSLSTFSIFFFSVSTLLLIGILFEEKFLSLEDRFDNYINKKKRQRRATKSQKNQLQKIQKEKRNTQAVSRSSNQRQCSKNFAA